MQTKFRHSRNLIKHMGMSQGLTYPGIPSPHVPAPSAQHMMGVGLSPLSSFPSSGRLSLRHVPAPSAQHMGVGLSPLPSFPAAGQAQFQPLVAWAPAYSPPAISVLCNRCQCIIQGDALLVMACQHTLCTPCGFEKLGNNPRECPLESCRLPNEGGDVRELCLPFSKRATPGPLGASCTSTLKRKK